MQIRGIELNQRDLAQTNATRAFELDAQRPRLSRAIKTTLANARTARIDSEELRPGHREHAFGIELQMRMSLPMERVRGNGIRRAAAVLVGWDKNRAAVVENPRHETVRRRAGIACKRAAREHVPNVIREPRRDTATD